MNAKEKNRKIASNKNGSKPKLKKITDYFVITGMSGTHAADKSCSQQSMTEMAGAMSTNKSGAE